MNNQEQNQEHFNQQNNFGNNNVTNHNQPYSYDESDNEKMLMEALKLDPRTNGDNNPAQNFQQPHQQPYQQPYQPEQNADFINQQNKMKFEANNRAKIYSEPKRDVVKPVIDKFDLREYIPIQMDLLPCYKFYPNGTMILIKACTVKDIQNYSMVDDSESVVSRLDVITKFNYMLENNTKVKLPNGTFASYKSIFEPDRFHIIYNLRELTFAKGKPLSDDVNCPSCGIKHNVPITSKNLTILDWSDKIKKFYTEDGYFSFPTKEFGMLKARPTTIGLQQAMYDYLAIKNAEAKQINLSAFEVLPYFILEDNLTGEDIAQKIDAYESIDTKLFYAMRTIAQEMKVSFSAKSAYVICECGSEVHTERIFPDKPSTLFIDDGGFDEFMV